MPQAPSWTRLQPRRNPVGFRLLAVMALAFPGAGLAAPEVPDDAPSPASQDVPSRPAATAPT